MKRKYMDRLDWEWYKVIERRYIQYYEENESFRGYVALLYLDKVEKPLRVKTNNNYYTVIDDGFRWMQFVPSSLNYVATAMIDQNDNLVKWYFDLVKEVGLEENRVYFDDLYLDIVYIPEKEIMIKDEDELQEALDKNIITEKDFELANSVGRNIVLEVKNNENYIINNFEHYYQQVQSKIKKRC